MSGYRAKAARDAKRKREQEEPNTLCVGVNDIHDHAPGCPRLCISKSGVLEPRSQVCFEAHQALVRASNNREG